MKRVLVVAAWLALVWLFLLYAVDVYNASSQVQFETNEGGVEQEGTTLFELSNQDINLPVYQQGDDEVPTPFPTPVETQIPGVVLTPVPGSGEAGDVFGRFLFAGAPPRRNPSLPGAFQVGLCEVLMDQSTGLWICAYEWGKLTDWLGKDGYFEIKDAPPGFYGLVIHPPLWFPVMPHDPDTGQEILFVLDGDIDLGTFEYDTEWCDVQFANCVFRQYLPIVSC